MKVHLENFHWVNIGEGYITYYLTIFLLVGFHLMEWLLVYEFIHGFQTVLDTFAEQMKYGKSHTLQERLISFCTQKVRFVPNNSVL